MGRGKGRRRPKSPVRARRASGLVGVVRVFGHRGEVETAEGTFPLTGRGLMDAMNGDRVYVAIQRGQRGRRAVVEAVIEHAVSTFAGTFDTAGPLGVVRPLDTRIKQDFFVVPSDPSPARYRVEPGDIVRVRIMEYPNRYESGVVTVEERLGGMDSGDLGIQCVMAKYDLSDGYPERPREEAEALALDVDAALQDPLRRDIRDRACVTIDPVDARDYDDALSLAPVGEGRWRLGVHIADVSHYVAWGSSLDLEARRRSTSVYLADRVLPMLPEHLSCDLCSLMPDEDRLAMTVDMELDAHGHVRSYDAYPSVIRSHARLDYDAVDAMLAAGSAGVLRTQGADATAEGADALQRAQSACDACTEQGFDVVGLVSALDKLARARESLRRKRGSIDFETVEVHALVDEAGVPLDLVQRRRTPATGLVEEAMLLANECVAERLAEEGRPAAFRVHEPPIEDNLTAASQVLLEMGAVDADLAGGIATGDARSINAAVERAHGTPLAPMVNALLLRSMQRALYKPYNEGHYALGAPCYCHFTSPIRRYPDLVCHRVLKLSLAREHLPRQAVRAYAACLVGSGPEALEKIAPQICRNASDRERIADMAAGATQKVKIAQYYESRVGETYPGVVAWIDKMGLFVRLDATGAEGLVPMRELGDEWFDFDERALRLVGAGTGTLVELGARALVRISSVDTVKGHLNLELVHVGGALH